MLILRFQFMMVWARLNKWLSVQNNWDGKHSQLQSMGGSEVLLDFIQPVDKMELNRLSAVNFTSYKITYSECRLKKQGHRHTILQSWRCQKRGITTWSRGIPLPCDQTISTI